ncbi:major facilitator superfamily domain-containing protein 6 [Anabrus simplex]|uniref:major facilitator superfamily domain-containing protein 6 n=1 Tax=Anabrus simplex TaxID=316456 RepID=UPI0035A270DB
MVKINYKLLPVKAHYFFFMASMGPILHQLNVFGKQLGVSEIVIGSINAILPILFLLAKPLFGLIVDYFRDQRKLVFIVLVCSMNMFYILMYFIPHPPVPVISEYKLTNIEFESDFNCRSQEALAIQGCGENRQVLCDWTCNNNSNGSSLSAILTKAESNSTDQFEVCGTKFSEHFNTMEAMKCNFTCVLDKTSDNADCLYGTPTFWSFVILMSLGTIGFNVANSISDAICFDVLGSGGEMGYGMQRVWGTLGFGVTALLSGLAVDMWSGSSATKDYTPAFLLVLVFGVIDFICCLKLELPVIPRSENIFKDLGKMLRHKHISIFLVFATFAGITDSFIIYFLFWYLEDLASSTGDMMKMKLLEGLVIAAETLVGEVIFFMLSGKILRLIGYGHSLTLCFLAYALRLGLVSFITSPWWVLPIELFMQGPSYAMCYTTIVAYASAVSPPGTSATMQGIVAGMDDGFGYAVGSMVGGVLYKWVGGRTAFKLFAGTALTCSIAHLIVYELFLKKTMIPAGKAQAEYRSPAEAAQMTQTGSVSPEKV